MSSPGDPEDVLRAQVMAALHGVIDPEVGINIVDLGLVYGVTMEGRRVLLTLTMTTPACPLGEQILREAEEQVACIAGVETASALLVWDPPWTPERMSDAARAQLGWNP